MLIVLKIPTEKIIYNSTEQIAKGKIIDEIFISIYITKFTNFKSSKGPNESMYLKNKSVLKINDAGKNNNIKT